jgi:hypothetical protein
MSAGISFNAPAYKYTSSSAFSYDADTGNDQGIQLACFEASLLCLTCTLASVGLC